MSNNYTVEILTDAQAFSAGINPAIYIGPIGPTPVLAIGTVEYGDEPRATITGTPEHPVLNLVLPRGLQGEIGPVGPIGPIGPTGATGVSVKSFLLTSGNGAPGTTDIYTLTLTNGVTVTVPVYHGKDGTGSGNMHTDVYDADRDGVVDRAAQADKATDADKLGGKAASEYALADDVPSVPSWAMQPSKPAYTANEVGALAAGGTAVDSAKLGGNLPAHYAPQSAVNELTNAVSRKQNQVSLLTLTLQGGSANWTNNRQTVTAPGVVVGDGQVGTPIPEDMEAWNDAEIKLLPATEAGKVTFACGSVPTANMIVRLMLTEVSVK